MKKILGLDLGTTSIGWALVNEAENDRETSSIVKLGVRVIPLSTDEEADFRKGNAISTNEQRRLKRGARRNFQRFKQRRKHLIMLLKKHNVLKNESALAETGKNSTRTLWQLRSNAVTVEIGLEEFARVLLSINKNGVTKATEKPG